MAKGNPQMDKHEAPEPMASTDPADVVGHVVDNVNDNDNVGLVAELLSNMQQHSNEDLDARADALRVPWGDQVDQLIDGVDPANQPEAERLGARQPVGTTFHL